ncbi:hypothetical protein VTN96DRAFT_9550 [Rasamsonia emersonii]|uniref:Mannosyltransferase 1, CMT1 n=1 Tax=Rasamsonia emersonii (strain ATCC 16479 / CBS 393.64 / IMI 116815) TaxID=1408163 RepID=A0A0F4Z5A2_RASE3|nr:hypothetical protein T310_0713 [Rasamsonia emersonii CBS 393.64]KKA25261.1 hypothetical protein T310_0713 [Rasamsonia emersonii CBS 393.64]
MSVRLLHPDEYELPERSSIDSQETFNLDDADFASHLLNKTNGLRRERSFLSRLLSASLSGFRRIARSPRQSRRRAACRGRRICFVLHVLTVVLVALIILTFIFRPSYTHLPPHYKSLRQSVLQSNTPGRGNPRNEKVFIAASLFDQGGELARGQWSQAVLDLIDLLGEDNVYLSIYENDSGEEGERALREFDERVPCNKSIVFEEHFDLSVLPTVTLPDGSVRTKRIAYLAEVRNRALRPLDEDLDTRYDKLLYLNDVYFDPLDAVQLLFSTNIGADGATRYRAACAVDFINPFKFYDTFATRDLQGYSMGLPFYPWFTSAGAGQSRQDVLDQKDAVRVRSCWGGMVAFDAKYFQGPGTRQDGKSPRDRSAERRFFQTTDIPPKGERRGPVRFRAEKDLFWESSECCLIHADIQDTPTSVDEISDTGIYMNPFIRVSYDPGTLSWLWITRRLEKLYSVVHDVASSIAGLPMYNPRRTEIEGDQVEEKVWMPNAKGDGDGSFVTVKRIAHNGGFCGRRDLQVVVMNREKGQDGWESIPVPPQ